MPKLITFILSAVASPKNKGVDTKAGEFFKNARRSGLWPEAEAIHRSSFTKARKKVSWKTFRDLLEKAVSLAYELWPQNSEFLWHGMSVYATDGSRYTLPATKEIREEFDPKSGLGNPGKGHFPICLVSTLYDVFRRLPIARTVVGIPQANEREEAKKLLPFILNPAKSVWLFDRGYPSFDLICYLIKNFPGYFIFRCPAANSFAAVAAFIKSGKKEAVIWLTPSNNYLSKIKPSMRKDCRPIQLRIIKLLSPDGKVSVILTNLKNKKEFSAKEIIALYFRRWQIETYYRDEKLVLEIEKFHAKTVNGILQELYAIMIMSIISRVLMTIASENFPSPGQELQFKNAIMTLAADAAVLVPHDPAKAVEIFNEIIQEIARVKYYRPQKPRLSQARITKKAVKKWSRKTLRYA